VAAPRRDSVDEAGYFADRLAEAHQPVAALVMNRLHPDFGPGGDAARAAAGVATAPAPAPADVVDAGDGVETGPDEPGSTADPFPLSAAQAEESLVGMRRNLADLISVATYERGYLELLESKIDGAVVKVPFLSKDVHDLDGLAAVAECLTGQVLSRRA